MRALAALLAMLGWAVGSAQAADGEPVPGTVASLRFEGNAVTQESVLRRELRFQEGTVASAEELERDRQALQDLGLFLQVEQVRERDAAGWHLRYRVQEKYYLLPLPRFSVNADGRYSYGAQLRWSNIAGRNHSLFLLAEQQNAELPGVGEQRLLAASYSLPGVTGPRDRWRLSASRLERPVQRAETIYEERFDSYGLGWSRSLGTERSTDGWFVGAGLSRGTHAVSGASAPVADGTATRLSGQLGYRDLRFLVHSEVGVSYALRVDVARDGWASDYDETLWLAGYGRYLSLGERPHQTLHLLAELGAREGDALNRPVFGLGGGNRLRAYPRNFVEGDAYYRLAAEWLRPVFADRWPWLRTVLVLETGSIAPRLGSLGEQRLHTSLGVGLRLRVPQFVNVEMELGWAEPIGGRGEGRVFGGGL